ncbi:MAG: reverse transcriptase domain-containing protein [bacterium]|nr:reverse transcriptase domain-containing protein [bacterium]
MKIQLTHSFEDIISIENLLEAWKEFLRGKRNKKDVQEFERNLMGNIISLHNDLSSKIYTHGGYQAFKINDPKPRNIHKASVIDRLLHHAIYRRFYLFFDKTFIADSYSCRLNKGTHKAINRFREFAYKTGKNNTKTCRILKCDIRKFFDNIDHRVLIKILENHIPDKNIIWLLKEIINSFSAKQEGGLPLGNLTSQLFVNIYMNEFDQFMKHKLKAKYYIRYADDFVVLSGNKEYLLSLVRPIKEFLQESLKLELHPKKLSISTIASGVDFLGWVSFLDHRILRTKTKKRMFKKLNVKNLQSYLGVLRHGNGRKIENDILSKYANILSNEQTA